MRHSVRMAGFTLLPVVLAMSLVAAIAFLLNRDVGMNADMVSRQADLARARYAAEAGLQAVNYKVQSVGCSGTYPVVSSPVTDSNFGGASYSAWGDNAAAPPTTLTSTGSYNGSAVTLTRSDIVAYRPGYYTYRLQPNPVASKDTYLDQTKPTRSFGSQPDVLLQTGKLETLLQFDVSVLPAGSRAVAWFDAAAGLLKPGAQLELYKTSSPSGSSATSLDVHAVTQSWVEGTTNSTADGATWTTWNGTNAWPTPQGYVAAPVASMPYNSAASGYVAWDITGIANRWMSGLYPNTGLWLRTSGAAITTIQFSSSDHPIYAQWPKISFNYLLPCGATAPVESTPVVTFEAIADTWIDASQGASSNYGGATSFTVTNAGKQGRGLVRFDLSGITAGTLLSNATLRLYSASPLSPPADSILTVNRVFDPWVEGTKSGSGSADGATWKTRDGSNQWSAGFGIYWGFGAGAPISTSAISSSFNSGWVEWNVTGLVQQWVDGIIPNHGAGVLIDTGSAVVFDSQESTTEAYRPKLVITY